MHILAVKVQVFCVLVDKINYEFSTLRNECQSLLEKPVPELARVASHVDCRVPFEGDFVSPFVFQCTFRIRLPEPACPAPTADDVRCS